MARRLELHELFKTFVDHVYFQSPGSEQMVYPCIVYKRDEADTKFAGNKPYSYVKRYMVTVIDRDPDSEIPDKVARQPLCLFNRNYAADGLHHDVFNLYF